MSESSVRTMRSFQVFNLPNPTQKSMFPLFKLFQSLKHDLYHLLEFFGALFIVLTFMWNRTKSLVPFELSLAISAIVAT